MIGGIKKMIEVSEFKLGPNFYQLIAYNKGSVRDLYYPYHPYEEHCSERHTLSLWSLGIRRGSLRLRIVFIETTLNTSFSSSLRNQKCFNGNNDNNLNIDEEPQLALNTMKKGMFKEAEKLWDQNKSKFGVGPSHGQQPPPPHGGQPHGGQPAPPGQYYHGQPYSNPPPPGGAYGAPPPPPPGGPYGAAPPPPPPGGGPYGSQPPPPGGAYGGGQYGSQPPPPPPPGASPYGTQPPPPPPPSSNNMPSGYPSAPPAHGYASAAHGQPPPPPPPYSGEQGGYGHQQQQQHYGHGQGYGHGQQQGQGSSSGGGKQSLQDKLMSKMNDPKVQAQASKMLKQQAMKKLFKGNMGGGF